MFGAWLSRTATCRVWSVDVIVYFVRQSSDTARNSADIPLLPLLLLAKSSLTKARQFGVPMTEQLVTVRVAMRVRCSSACHVVAKNLQIFKN